MMTLAFPLAALVCSMGLLFICLPVRQPKPLNPHADSHPLFCFPLSASFYSSSSSSLTFPVFFFFPWQGGPGSQSPGQTQYRIGTFSTALFNTVPKLIAYYIGMCALLFLNVYCA